MNTLGCVGCGLGESRTLAPAMYAKVELVPADIPMLCLTAGPSGNNDEGFTTIVQAGAIGDAKADLETQVAGLHTFTLSDFVL